jgi:hypothetical protein
VARGAFLSVTGHPHAPRPPVNESVTLKAQQPSESNPPLWRWYDRLDGSSDLYCDGLMDSQHVARLVFGGGSFRLSKPDDLTAETWLTRDAAHEAVRSKLKRLAA